MSNRKFDIVIWKMAWKCCRPKYGEYEVCVTIIEGKYLPQNGNPVVVVKVGHHQKKKTRVCNRTDTPYYNEVCLEIFLV